MLKMKGIIKAMIRFYYFEFISDVPAVRMNLASPEYQIRQTLLRAGFEPYPEFIHIGRKHFWFLSETDISRNALTDLDRLLLEIPAYSALCARFGQTDGNGSHLRRLSEIACGCVIGSCEFDNPTDVVAKLEYHDLNDIAPLFEDYRYYDEIEEGAFKRAFYTYHHYGINSREFQLAKLDYLASVPLVEGRCHFPDNSWHFYQIGRYYPIRIALDDPSYFSRFLESGLESYAQETNRLIFDVLHSLIIPGSCLLSTTPLVYPLEELFAPVEIISDPERLRPVNALNPATAIDEALIFYVGQALTVGLFENQALQAFFDFGLPDSFNRRYFPNYNTVAAAIASLMANSGQLSTIILSHIHADHINMGMQIPASYVLNWHVPTGYSSAKWTQISARIHTAGGNVTLYPTTAAPTTWGNLAIRRITTPNSTHPHHNGIYAKVNFNSGNHALFSGDCILAPIKTIEGAAYTYDYLQASHHGGAYFRTLGTRTTNDIPQPNTPAQSVCYSYSPVNRHGHPSYTTDYSTRGWTTRTNTPTAPHLPAYISAQIAVPLQGVLRAVSWN